MALTKATFSMIENAPFNVADYGAIGDGVTDNTSAIQDAIDAMPAGSLLWFPEGNWAFDSVLFDVSLGQISGPGAVLGTLNLASDRIRINGLTFKPSPISATARGINLITGGGGSISNCIFRNLETCISVLTSDATGQASRYTITNCLYGGELSTACDYFIVAEPVTGFTFSTADWIIANNNGNALVDHIFLDTFDGVTIHDNVFFGFAAPDYNRNFVRLDFGTWAHIHDNKFFESGSESIRIDQITNVNIHDNTHAYPGKYIQTNAIAILGVPTPGGTGTTNCIVHDEIIIEPSGAGIFLDGNQGYAQIHSNYIYAPGANSRYFGPVPLTGATIGVNINSSAAYINTYNNFVVSGTNTLPAGGANQTNTHQNNTTVISGLPTNQTVEKTLTLSGTETTVDVARWDYVNFSQSGAASVTAITNSEGIKTVSMRFFNGNTTLVNSADLKLRGGVNVTPANNNAITFVVENSTATEIARNF